MTVFGTHTCDSATARWSSAGGTRAQRSAPRLSDGPLREDQPSELAVVLDPVGKDVVRTVGHEVLLALHSIAALITRDRRRTEEVVTAEILVVVERDGSRLARELADNVVEDDGIP